MFPRASVKHVLGQIRQGSGGTSQARGVSRRAVVISARSVVTAAAWTSARASALPGFGVSDDGDPGQMPGEDVGRGVADQDAFGVLGVQKAHCLADPVGAGFHPFGVVVVAGHDGPDVAVQPVIGR
jgi:hypothetical protein